MKIINTDHDPHDLEHTRGQAKYRGNSEEEQQKRNYLDIWDRVPSFKDVNFIWGLLKLASFCIIAGSLVFATYLISLNIALAIILPIIIGGFALFTFRDHIFAFSFLGQKNYGKIDPFKGFSFWRVKGQTDTLCFTNTEDLVNTGIRILRISTIPENIQPNLNHFIEELHRKGVSFSYQVVQTPLVYETSTATYIAIYFTLSVSFKGFLTQVTVDRIKNTLNGYEDDFKNTGISNLAHFKIEKLNGTALIDAFKSVFCKIPIPPEQPKQEEPTPLERLSILKVIVMVGFLIYSDIVWVLLVPQYWYGILFINCMIIGLFCFLFWRSLLYHFSKHILLETEIAEIDPFRSVTFYRFPGFKHTVFVHSHKTMLSAVNFFNIIEAFPQQFIRKDHFLARVDKFFRALINTQLPFSYTIVASPLDNASFERIARKYCTQKIAKNLYGLKTLHERNKWYDMRNGVWKMMVVCSVSTNQFTSQISEKVLTELGEKVRRKSKGFVGVFEADFTNYQIKHLSKRESDPALKVVVLKSKFFRLNGTHLKYQVIQGKTLMNLIEISHEFKKGIETRIAAEFNTPLNLKNFVEIGNTLNTEYLGEEMSAGFTREQVKNLLLTNGSFLQRQNLLMKLAGELVKCNIPSIVFDYDGSFSKLIRHFKGTQFENKFLHFKLGQNFRIDPLGTDIPYAKSKDRYIDLVVDILALIYKKGKSAMDQLRKKLKDENFSLLDLIMEKETQNRWEKDYNLEYASSELDFLKDNPSVILNKNITDGVEDIVLPHQFIMNDKTIIIDLSIFLDLEPKVFLSFIIMIKIRYYMLYKLGLVNPPKFNKKLFILPNIDIVFSNQFLERYSKFGYSKVNKFLAWISDKQFGLISTSNQIHNLHPNVFNYLENIITFKAFDKRDIATLRNLMKLQEMHGTGYYSNSRKEAYQIEFLMGLKPNEAIVRRIDINQAFPVIIDTENIEKLEPLSKEERIEYMSDQGYDLQDSENRILSDARKTLFEQHFESFYMFIEEIMKFFEILEKLDNIGNLYKAKIKEELLKILTPKAREKLGNNKTHIKKLRDRIFENMLKYGYIIEAHPRKASGSQSIRPSYAIGPQYQASIDDYYEVNKERPTKVSFDVISRESDETEMFESLFRDEEGDEIEEDPEFELESIDGETSPKQPTIPDEKVIETTINHTGQFLALLARIHTHIGNREFETALFLERTAIKKLIMNIYTEGHPDLSVKISDKYLEEAIEFVMNRLNLSITPNYLRSLLHLSKDDEISRDNITQVLQENLETLIEFSHIFRDDLESITEGEE